MNGCTHTSTEAMQALMAEVLFGTPTDADRDRLIEHIGACEVCAREWQSLQTTLQVTRAAERPEPPETFWDNYHERLVARMAEERAPHHPLQADREAQRRTTGLRFHHGVLAAVLLAVGIGIGWLLFARPVALQLADDQQAQEAPEVLQPASVEARAQQYVRRSKVLLLGLVNFDPAQEPAEGFNLPHKQAVARTLVEEADALKRDLDAADEQRLTRLITELEAILQEIAALEAQADVPAIEQVQSAVDQQALLLKINLTEMQRTDQQSQRPASRTGQAPL